MCRHLSGVCRGIDGWGKDVEYEHLKFLFYTLTEIYCFSPFPPLLKVRYTYSDTYVWPISHYIKYVAPNYKTIVFSKMGKSHSTRHVRAHCFVRHSCHCFHTTYLARILFKVRQDVGAQVRRLADYAYFAQTSSRASHFVTMCCLRTHMNLFSAHYESDILNSMHIM